MKKSLLFIIFLSGILHSQISKIELIKCEPVGVVSQGVYYLKNEQCSDGNYKFSFRDLAYTRIDVSHSFKFKDIDGAYENLFTTIIDGFSNKLKDDIAFELPDHYLIIKYMSVLGIKAASFYVKDKITGESGGSNYYTQRQIYKLFGKKRP